MARMRIPISGMPLLKNAFTASEKLSDEFIISNSSIRTDTHQVLRYTEARANSFGRTTMRNALVMFARRADGAKAASPATVALTPTEFDGVSAVGDRNLVPSRRPEAPHGIGSER
ncbi:hypothetical protein E4U32_001435 [Claviceps aff. humidiphila group G2b]|nr:hypothetical protein E4U32_001435 [Claviceps aff. humidiphila group G2b]